MGVFLYWVLQLCSSRVFSGGNPACQQPGLPNHVLVILSMTDVPELLWYALFLVASLLLVVGPGAFSSVLAPSSDARSP